MNEKTALIVDDADTDRLLLKRVLEKLGYRTIEAPNGEVGVQLALQHRPSVIFMDVVMPKLSGFEATRDIKETDETKDIPVIICSSKSLATDEIWARKQGANGYIVKPITEEAVLAALGSVKHAVAA